MRVVTRYQANDGTEFHAGDAAARHDALIVECADAIAPLGPRFDGFSGGNGYVQHDLDAFVEAKRALLALLARAYPSHGYDKLDAKDVHPMSSVGRMASEAGGPLAKAWGRLGCIDAAAREWEQPYYALHPEQGNDVMLEDRRHV